MSGVGIQWQMVDLLALQLRIDAIAHMDTRGMMDAIGAEVATQTKRRIGEEKTSPDGQAWPQWSERYAATRHAGQSLLQSEGHLLDSITHVVELGGKDVDIGSNLVYARIHQFGGAKVGKPGLPARPYLGISAENRQDIHSVASHWLDAHLQATLQ